MMKRSLILLGIILLAAVTRLPAQSLNCKKFKNGTFKMINAGRPVIVKRTGAIQSEYFNNSNEPATYKVKWVNNCTCMLTPTAATLKKFPIMPKNAKLTVKLIKTTQNTYQQKVTSNFNNKVLLGEVLKIK